MPVIINGNGTVDTGTVLVGNSDITGLAAGALPSTVIGAGGILQVVSATHNTFQGLTSATWVDTGLTASITPSSATSKILILVCMRAYANITCDYGGMRLLRGATTLLSDARVCLRDASSPGSDQVWNRVYLDSPATTSSTTYKLQAQNGNANGTFYTMLDGNLATITLMEIAA